MGARVAYYSDEQDSDSYVESEEGSEVADLAAADLAEIRVVAPGVGAVAASSADTPPQFSQNRQKLRRCRGRRREIFRLGGILGFVLP